MRPSRSGYSDFLLATTLIRKRPASYRPRFDTLEDRFAQINYFVSSQTDLPPGAPRPRRGVILLVVVILLALFAVVGLTFVLYAEAEAVSSRVHKEAEVLRRADAEPELLLSYFLSQLIYDVPDSRLSVPPTADPNNSVNSYPVNSAMRGHSLVRSLTGYYDPTSPPPPGQAQPTNDDFYNGIGRIHTPGGFDEFDRINFMTTGGTVFDPERPTGGHAPGTPLTPYVGGFNPSYTYPDANNMFLASMRPSDGAILMQSFHRTWLGGKLTAINSANPLKHLRAPLPFAPENDGGDVKNYMDGPGFFDGTAFHNNDSIWMDLGYPVRFAPDGKRYKPLFAPLVLDLDNRLNLIAHGNIRGPNNTHVSNQGFGPWEVNLTALSNGNPVKAQEWANIFLASQVKPDLIGRYGGTIDPKTGQVTLDGKPSSGTNPNAFARIPPLPRFFSQVDFDGDDTTAGGGIKLPNNPRDPFPTYGAGYGNFNAAEITDHPGLYNPNRPMGDDKDLGATSNLEAILRYGDTGSHALTSNLFQFLPKNLGDPADGARIRRLITLISADIDQPAPSPWVWDRKDKNGWLRMPAKLGSLKTDFPTGNPIGFPTTQGAKLGDAPPPGYGNVINGVFGYSSEFGGDWKAAGGRRNPRKTRDLGRLDLNRSMPDYPALDAQGNITDPVGYQAAVLARQLLAKDIFKRLCHYTNAPPCIDDQGTALAPTDQPAPGTPEYDALRWLAQLAVNVVDYIDNDDYITPFNWNTNYTNDVANGWVFGTELPRVTLNECYAEYTQAVGTIAAQKKYNVNVGVKLLNPFKTDPVRPSESSDAKLPGKYRLLVCKQSAAQTLAQRQNPLGAPADPADYYQVQSGGNAILTFDNAQAGVNDTVKACNATAGQGYYWVSNGNVPKSQNNKQPDLSVTATIQTTDITDQPVIVLQRLMCPGGPSNTDPTDPLFNPWITIDYLDQITLNDSKGMNNKSRARTQPYGGSGATSQAPCFVTDNSVAKVPDWLVHLDRQLVSVPEVLLVSAFKPSQLTHQFDTGKNGHLAPWFDETTRLYRSLEMVTTHRVGNGYMASPNSIDSIGTTNLTTDAFDTGGGVYQCGVFSRYGTTRSGTPWKILVGSHILVGTGQNAELVEVVATPDETTIQAAFKRAPQKGAKVQLTTLGDRLVGRVNINTLQPDITGATGKPASTVFRALCDAQAPNFFTQAEVDDVFADLMASRTQDPNGIPGPNDRPFLTPTIGVYPANDPQFPPRMGGKNTGIEDTVFRSVPAGSPRAAKGASRLFDSSVAPPHEYLKKSLLTKIYSNITLRSNVFAIWVTVGFFEVTDARGTLGQEIGKSEGRNVRHRMFSIVDRSAFAKSSTDGGGVTHILTQPITPDFPGGGLVDVYPKSMTDIHEGFTAHFAHSAQSNKVTATGVQQPDLVMMTGFQQKFDAGATISFTATVPQFIEPGHIPKLDQNGIQIRAQQTFTATVVTPITQGSGLIQLSDPSLLQYVRPGSTSVSVQDQAYLEAAPVTQLLPAGQQPDHFSCRLSKVYNIGDTVSFSFPRPTPDPNNPGPQILWNTRDDRGSNNPILFYSVID